jgi:glycosyltransferase involved in cell wall biosynthesis
VIINLSMEMQQSGAYEPIIGCIVKDQRHAPALWEAAQQKSIRTELFRIRNSRLLLDYARFLRQLKTIGPQIIHSHGYKPSVFAYPAAKMARIPVTATCHLWYVDKDAPLKMRCMIQVEKATYRRFPMVFAVSPAIRDTLLNAGVSERRVRVVNNGIPLPDSTSRDACMVKDAAERFGVELGQVCVVNVGRLTHQKSQSTIVDAARLLNDRGRHFKFIIAGEGEMRETLQQQIADANVVESVRLVGFIDPIADLLSIATVFVLPSRDEGMPVSLLEAVACHIPVVATKVGAIGSVIKHKESGLLIEPDRPVELADAIEEIVDNPIQSKSFAERAYDYLASSYSSDSMFREYDHNYRQILQQRCDL